MSNVFLTKVGMIEVQGCPITCGLETRMTMDAFSALCKTKRAARVWGGGGRVPAHKYCQKCGGSVVPPEITFIELEEMMPKKEKIGKCAGCGREKKLRQVGGCDNAYCSTCDMVAIMARNHPDWLQNIAAANGVDVDGNAEAAIMDSNALADIKRMQAELDDLRDQHDSDTTAINGLRVSLQKQADEAGRLKADIHSACEALDCGEDDIVGAAFRIAADLREARGQRGAKLAMLATSTDTQREIVRVCEGIAEMLIQKNAAYGDSAVNPVRIFSKADTLEQINVRIDDKLSRLMRGHELAGEDTATDLLGYLVLRQVAMGRTGGEVAP